MDTHDGRSSINRELREQILPLFNRFELLYQNKFQPMANMIAKDIRSISLETEVVKRIIDEFE